MKKLLLMFSLISLIFLVNIHTGYTKDYLIVGSGAFSQFGPNNWSKKIQKYRNYYGVKDKTSNSKKRLFWKRDKKKKKIESLEAQIQSQEIKTEF
ncbi:MAG: hypothetical protein QNJ31_04165 [Candidatus Caenarcaniphilales bacterium]|nr:hypothetical protein [Candidatus Caenarcaniphilales bacterium]